MDNTESTVPLTFVTLPIWWYTTGLFIVLQWFNRQYRSSLHAFTGSWFWKKFIDPNLDTGDSPFYALVSLVAHFMIVVVRVMRIVVLCLVFVFYILVLPAVLTAVCYQILGLYAS